MDSNPMNVSVAAGWEGQAPHLSEGGRSCAPLLGRREIINPREKRLSCQAFRGALAVVICCSAVGNCQVWCLIPQPCS